MKRQPITYEPTPDLSTERQKPKVKVAVPLRPPSGAATAVKEPTGTEMLSARVDILIGRQFRALAKLRGIKVQALLQTAISEFLERNRF